MDRVPSGVAENQSTSLPRVRWKNANVEIHDRHQLEVRFRHSIGPDTLHAHDVVEMYLFIPKTLGIHNDSYRAEHFYADLTPLMRLDAEPLSLSQLADASYPGSPLSHLTEVLESFRTSPRPPASGPANLQVQLFAHLFAVGVRADLRALEKSLRRMGNNHLPNSLVGSTAAALARMQRALAAYRRVRQALWPFENVCDRSLQETLRAADEYMSLTMEERVAAFVLALSHRAGVIDGSGSLARVRALCAGALAEEAELRARLGYLRLHEPDARTGEYFTFHASMLKKIMQRALYLDPRNVTHDRFVRNAAAGVAAALAAIWAFATQLPSSHAVRDATTQWVLFVLAVLAYVAKDRIKAMVSESLVRRVRKHDHVATLMGGALDAVGLGMLQIRVAEAFRFVTRTGTPTDVLALRDAARHTFGEPPGEEIVAYHKDVRLDVARGAGKLPAGFRMRQLLRFNVRRLLARMDDPLDEVSYFDGAAGRFAHAQLPKVYHVHLALVSERRHVNGPVQRFVQTARIVLDKNGIVRVEQTDEPASTAGRRVHSASG